MLWELRGPGVGPTCAIPEGGVLSCWPLIPVLTRKQGGRHSWLRTLWVILCPCPPWPCDCQPPKGKDREEPSQVRNRNEVNEGY